MVKLSNKAYLFLDKIGQILYNILVEILMGINILMKGLRERNEQKRLYFGGACGGLLGSA